MTSEGDFAEVEEDELQSAGGPWRGWGKIVEQVLAAPTATSFQEDAFVTAVWG
jgi:hypothetical protein